MFFKWLGHWLIRFRAPLLALMLAVSLAAAASLPGLEFDFGADALLEFSEDEEAFAQQVNERFGTRDHLVLVVLHRADGGSVLSPQGLGLLHELTAGIEAIDGIDSAFGVTRVPRRELRPGLLFGAAPRPLIDATPVEAADVARVREAVSGSPVFEGQLVSQDHRTAAIVLSVAETHAEPTGFGPVLDDIERTTDALVARYSADGAASFDVHYGGMPYLRTATVRAMQSEQLVLWPAVVAVYVLMLLVLFRRLKPALLPLVAVGAATLWTLGLMVATGQRMNMLNNAVPMLILVIGVTNSIHIMFRIYDEARELARERCGRSADATHDDDGRALILEAVRRGVARMGVASLLTTLTAAIGFAALLIARSSAVTAFGLLTAAGIMLAWLAIIALLPVLLSYAHRGRAARREATDEKKSHAPAHGQRLARWLPRLVAPTLRRPRAVLAGAVGLLAVAAVVAVQMPIDANFLETLEPDHPITRSNTLIERQLGGIMPLDLDLRAEPGTFARADVLQRVAGLEAEIAATDGVLSVLSVVDVLGETGVGGSREGAVASDAAVSAALGLVRAGQPQALAAMATDDMSEIRVMVRLEASGVRHNLQTIHAIEAAAERHFAPGSAVDARLTGLAYLASVGLNTFVRDLLGSLLTAACVIFIVLVLAFRSLRIGLLSLLPTLMPLGITVALMPLFGYALNATTIIVFTITLGLAVDNTIHILVRFAQERRHHATLDEAIAATLRGSGRAIVLSNLLLVGGFAVMAFSTFMPIRTVAVLSATTIVAALLTALFLMPAQLKLFGERAFARDADGLTDEADETDALPALTGYAAAAATTGTPSDPELTTVTHTAARTEGPGTAPPA